MQISKTIFDKNFSCLERTNPQFAAKVKNYRPTVIDFKVISGRSNTICVSGIQLSSRHKPEQEAALQASYLLKFNEIYLYGIGLGYLPETLLNRKGLRKLNIKVLNLSLFCLIISVRDQVSWINDKRVNITLASSDSDVRKPYFSLSPDIFLADDPSQTIKNILHTNKCDYFSKKQFKLNEPSLLARIEDNHIYIKKDNGVECLRDIALNADAIVVGAGPSLGSTISKIRFLQSNNKRLIIISVGTATNILVKNGIVPEFVVVIDKDISETHPLIANFSEMIETSLIYSPIVQSDFIKAWLGARYVAYSESTIFNEVKKLYPKGSLFSGGSVIHTAIDLARSFGCRNITLFGVDFAYSNNQTHAGYEVGKLTNYENIRPANKANRWVKDGNGNSIPTHDSFIGYLLELERYIRRYPDIKFWNSSKNGAFIRGCNFIKDHP